MLRNVFGRPFIDLEPYLDGDALAALDDEVCLGLTRVELEYTGGSHRSMGIVPPSMQQERRYPDYGEVIAQMSRHELATFLSLSETPDAFHLERRDEYEFGEERQWPLSRQQMHYLEYRHGVYFPWKVFYELMPNGKWEERGDGAGKRFTDEAQWVFPETVAFVERLPFVHIGRCNVLGLRSNDHGTIHRDGENEPHLGHFITLCPRADKRLFLWDDEASTAVPVSARAYWFDDRNYHGVAADPVFRYSIRVDGVFEPAFVARLKRDFDVAG